MTNADALARKIRDVITRKTQQLKAVSERDISSKYGQQKKNFCGENINQKANRNRYEIKRREKIV